MNKKNHVAIFTGNRAEYGLLYPIIKAISQDKRLTYSLIASGAHLDKKFGYTLEEIENDGFKVDATVKAEIKTDTLLSTTQAIGNIVLSMSKVLDKMKPDMLMVYADRFEGLAAVIAGGQIGLPVIHVEGGDVTGGGALDDYVRHAMTKLSHVHFTTNADAANRIAKLGEEKWRIHNVGFSVIDLIKQGQFATPSEICQKYGVTLDKPVILFSQHSVTSEVEDVVAQIKPSIEAMIYFADKGIQVIATYPNNDAGGRRIIKEWEKVEKLKHPYLKIYSNLGRHNYHGVLNVCGKAGVGVYVGNSSSGIKETPAFGCPFVNVGTRQKGRLRARNVIDVGYDYKQIVNAVEKSLFNKNFRRQCTTCQNPYGQGNTGKQVADILAKLAVNKKLIQKQITY